jgi:hypothetical protein
MAKIKPEFLIASFFVGGGLGVVALFSLGFIVGLLGLDIDFNNFHAYACCFSTIAVVMTILIFLQIRSPEKEVTQIQYYPPPQIYSCPICQSPLQYRPEYSRWYCNGCNRYI